MNDKEALKIVTLTSWKNRLQNLPKVLDSIYTQTIVPDKVVLNLSIDEFNKKEEVLPFNILEYLVNHNVEIYWVDGKDTKQWKKIIPTLFRYPKDWIICIDDDRLYDRTFIEKLWKKHLECPNNPITLNKGYRVKGYLQHCGHGTLECMEFYNNFSGIDIQEVIDRSSSSDTFFNYILSKNNHPLVSIDGFDGSVIFNETNPLSKSNATKDPKKHKELWEWLSSKYGQVKSLENVGIMPKNIVALMYGDVTLNKTKNILNSRKVVRKFKN